MQIHVVSLTHLARIFSMILVLYMHEGTDMLEPRTEEKLNHAGTNSSIHWNSQTICNFFVSCFIAEELTITQVFNQMWKGRTFYRLWEFEQFSSPVNNVFIFMKLCAKSIFFTRYTCATSSEPLFITHHESVHCLLCSDFNTNFTGYL